MGTDRKSVGISASVSRHNSPKDHRDDALWDLLVAEINMLCKNEKFKPIQPEVENWMGY